MFCFFWLLCVNMPGTSWDGPLPSLSPEEQRLRQRLRNYVEHLSVNIGERHYGVPANLRQAEQYIEQTFSRISPNVHVQKFTARDHVFRNIWIEFRGTELPDEIIVIGGHYDTVYGSPGADDNATAVAALFETAKAFNLIRLKRTVRFVAFANEEPPFFHTENMGSLHYAQQCRQAGDSITAMYCYESLGYYTDEPGSQSYPVRFLKWFYPDTGNFIAFVGDLGSKKLTRQTVRDFRDSAKFPSVGFAAPRWMPGVSLSDHWSFWQYGYRAVMITDTPILRNPHYHKMSDRPEYIDFDRFTMVISGLIRTILKAVNS